ncbi:MAG: acetylxylan esterase [Thermoprotei archaeon]|nr:MAG: acetylxylan esterase [Thermoprotei archaeon]
MSGHFRPLAYYEWLYDNLERELEFRARSVAEWLEWRLALKRKLAELLGGFRYPRRDLSPEVLKAEERDGYLMEKVVYWSDELTQVPAYVLIPEGLAGRAPAVVALHGHGRGKDEIVGMGGYQKDFALELVKRGLVVLVPDQCGFGERREEDDVREGRSSCWKLSTWALMFGETAIGRRVWDAIKGLEYLASRPDVNGEAIGFMGISGGGTTALFASALDDRVKAVVVSGYLNTFKDSILSIQHCIDNYVPGILRYCEMYDVAALVAPRPMLVEHGTRDKIFPVEATRRAVERVRRAYELLGVPERLEVDIFEGGHEISGRRAYDFLVKWLSSGYWEGDELYSKSRATLNELLTAPR